MLHKHSVIFRSVYYTGKLNKQVDNGPADLLTFLIHISSISCPAHGFSSPCFSGLFFSFLSLLLFLLFFKVYSDTHLRKLCSAANMEIKAEWPPLQPTLHLTGFELCMMLRG